MPIGTRHLVAPELAEVLAALPSIPADAAALRMMRQQPARAMPAPALTPEETAVRREQRMIPGVAGEPDVRVLVYSPAAPSRQLRPAILHLHAGGYVLGAPEMGDLANRATVVALDCVVVSVDYRLAPETPFPGALNDNHAALAWMADAADALGIDATRIAIAGESAGGGHAAMLALHMRNRGGVRPCFLSLHAPMLDDRTGTPAGAAPHPHVGEFMWTPANNRFGWNALLGRDGVTDAPPGGVPARADDLAGLPPTFLLVGALDLLVEENLEFARRLVRAGVPTELHLVPGAYHGFLLAGRDTPQARQCIALTNAALSRAFAQSPAFADAE